MLFYFVSRKQNQDLYRIRISSHIYFLPTATSESVGRVVDLKSETETSSLKRSRRNSVFKWIPSCMLSAFVHSVSTRVERNAEFCVNVQVAADVWADVFYGL